MMKRRKNVYMPDPTLWFLGQMARAQKEQKGVCYGGRGESWILTLAEDADGGIEVLGGSGWVRKGIRFV